jgi:hypothetical protein
MAHEYAKEAKASHERKLKSYGKDEKALGSKEKAKNWAGLDALNTNEQAGLRPLNKDASLSKDTSERIMRRAGGKVHGAQSLKRLDKAPRKGKAVGGQMMGTGQRIGAIPSPQTEQEDFDPQLRGVPGQMAPGTMRRKGGKVQDYEARSHESQGSQGLRKRQAHAKGGKSEHPDEAEDKALIRKMVKAKDLKMKDGGAAKRKKYEDGGGKLPSPYESMESAGRLKEIRTEDRPEPSESEAAKTYNREGANAVHDMEARKKGGRTKRASGGGAFDDYMGDDSSAPKSSGKSGKGKTTLNIMIGQGPQQPQGPNPMQAMALAELLGPKGGPGMAPPPPPAPPPGGAPMPMPASPPVMPQGASPMAPPGGATPPGPMLRASGGRAQEVQVPYKKPGRTSDGYPKMNFGSGTGMGRKQKVDSYGLGPTKSKDNY